MRQRLSRGVGEPGDVEQHGVHGGGYTGRPEGAAADELIDASPYTVCAALDCRLLPLSVRRLVFALHAAASCRTPHLQHALRSIRHPAGRLPLHPNQARTLRDDKPPCC